MDLCSTSGSASVFERRGEHEQKNGPAEIPPGFQENLHSCGRRVLCRCPVHYGRDRERSGADAAAGGGRFGGHGRGLGVCFGGGGEMQMNGFMRAVFLWMVVIAIAVLTTTARA